MPNHDNFHPTHGKTSDQSMSDAGEWYERGMVLRKAGLFDQAIEQFQKAATDHVYALKAYAQIGLCHKSRRRYEEAAKAFRSALNSPAASKKETVQILYVLARTLESLGRVGEALEFYRWLRREDGQFRDVTERIATLSATRTRPQQASNTGGTILTQPASQVLQNLLRSTK